MYGLISYPLTYNYIAIKISTILNVWYCAQKHCSPDYLIYAQLASDLYLMCASERACRQDYSKVSSRLMDNRGCSFPLLNSKVRNNKVLPILRLAWLKAIESEQKRRKSITKSLETGISISNYKTVQDNMHKYYSPWELKEMKSSHITHAGPPLDLNHFPVLNQSKASSFLKEIK